MFKRIIYDIGKLSFDCYLNPLGIQLNLTKMLSSSSMPKSQIESEEIVIKVPWGHISGKWWGPKKVRPILCLHGWQDNAGSFDTLIPLLPHNISYLAIDMPGHGFSSRLADGMVYNHYDAVVVLKSIKKLYAWPKLSILSHSAGSLLSFWYTSLFPDEVDFYVSIDMLKPNIKDPVRFIKTIENDIEKFLIADERNRLKTEPPSYTMDELRNILHSGTSKSISLASTDYLLKRAVAKSTMHPNKYYFTRDSRLKHVFPAMVDHQIILELAKRIKCPHLFIKSKESRLYENKKYFDETLEVLQESNSDFKIQYIDGTHHLHLNTPERVSGIITAFLEKHQIASDL